jgi:hypothetical protein
MANLATFTEMAKYDEQFNIVAVNCASRLEGLLC